MNTQTMKTEPSMTVEERMRIGQAEAEAHFARTRQLAAEFEKAEIERGEAQGKKAWWKEKPQGEMTPKEMRAAESDGREEEIRNEVVIRPDGRKRSKNMFQMAWEQIQAGVSFKPANERTIPDTMRERGLSEGQIVGLKNKWHRDMNELNAHFFPDADERGDTNDAWKGTKEIQAEAVQNETEVKTFIDEFTEERKAFNELMREPDYTCSAGEKGTFNETPRVVRDSQVSLEDWSFDFRGMEEAENGERYPSGDITAVVNIEGRRAPVAFEEAFDEAGNYAGYQFADTRENRGVLSIITEKVLGEDAWLRHLEGNIGIVEKANTVFAPIVKDANEKLEEWQADRDNVRER